MGKPNRPVDMSDSFKENGWEYCKYLITDPRCDKYLSKSAQECPPTGSDLKNTSVEDSKT